MWHLNTRDSFVRNSSELISFQTRADTHITYVVQVNKKKSEQEVLLEKQMDGLKDFIWNVEKKSLQTLKKEKNNIKVKARLGRRNYTVKQQEKSRRKFYWIKKKNNVRLSQQNVKSNNKKRYQKVSC